MAVDGARIAVADTGHHRPLVGTLQDGGRRMRVERVERVERVVGVVGDMWSRVSS